MSTLELLVLLAKIKVKGVSWEKLLGLPSGIL